RRDRGDPPDDGRRAGADAMSARAGRRKALAATVAVLAALMLLPAALGLFLSLFLFDAPGSESSPLTSALAAGLWLAPVLLVLAFVLAIRAFRAPLDRPLWPAAIALLVPPVWIGLLVVMIESVCG